MGGFFSGTKYRHPETPYYIVVLPLEARLRVALHFFLLADFLSLTSIGRFSPQLYHRFTLVFQRISLFILYTFSFFILFHSSSVTRFFNIKLPTEINFPTFRQIFPHSENIRVSWKGLYTIGLTGFLILSPTVTCDRQGYTPQASQGSQLQPLQ